MKTEEETEMGPNASTHALAASPTHPSALSAAYVAGRRAWPTIDVCRSTFDAHCRRVLGETPGYDWACHAGDLYLCCACCAGDREAVRLLEREMLAPIGRAQLRRHKNRELLQETLQSLRTKLLVGPGAKLGAYAARGSLSAWLGVAAARMLVDVQRAQRSHATLHPNLDVVDSADADPEAHLLRERFLPSFSRALSHALAAASDRDRHLLRLCLDGTTIDELGRAYCIHRATAARWLGRARHRVLVSLRLELMLRHHLSNEEFDGIARELCEHLDATLASLPEPEPDAADAGSSPRRVWAPTRCLQREAV